MAAIDSVRDVATGVVGSFKDRPILGTALIRAFGLTKIPLLWFIKPSVVEMTDERCVVRVPLRRRTKNHLGVMYIGAMVAGADIAGGLTAMRIIQDSGRRVDLLFKDLQAEFFKRVEGDAYFTCEAGAAIRQAVQQTIDSGERVNLPVKIVTTVPSELGDTPAAQFGMTLTLKAR